jgi:hypothetical protein
VTNELSQQHLNHLNTALYFEPLRPLLLQQYFPDSDLVDLRDELHTDYSSDNHFVIHRLRACLPFGHYLTTEQRNFCISPLVKKQLLHTARVQHHFWSLARSTVNTGYPVNHLAIYYNSDHFWHYHVPRHEAAIVYWLLRRNQPAFFLRRYTLLGTTLTLEFGELHVNSRLPADNLAGFRLVHVNGTEFRLNILDTTDNPPWNITQFDRDISLLDPEGEFFIPPRSPDDPDFDPDAHASVQYYLPVDWSNDSDTASLPTVSTPPPTLEWTTPPEPGWTNTNPYRRSNPCSCTTEFCRCGRRPDTPPTPPNITLWTPGDQHLPYRN